MKPVLIRGPSSPRMRRTCAILGVQLVRAQAAPFRIPGLARVAKIAATAVSRGKVALITGPSGGGKSTLVRTIAARLRGTGALVRTAVIPTHDRRTPLLDFVAGGRAARDRCVLSALAAAGLAEAALLPRPLHELSDGQRARAALAAALVRVTARRAARAQSRCIIADEFASVLDRVTAMSLARSAVRFARARRIGLLAATAHRDVERWLRPDLLIRVPLDGRAQLLRNS